VNQNITTEASMAVLEHKRGAMAHPSPFPGSVQDAPHNHNNASNLNENEKWELLNGLLQAN